jgi:hypothetical protein
LAKVLVGLADPIEEVAAEAPAVVAVVVAVLQPVVLQLQVNMVELVEAHGILVVSRAGAALHMLLKARFEFFGVMEELFHQLM